VGELINSRLRVGTWVRHLGVGGQQADERVEHVSHERVAHKIHRPTLQSVQQLAWAERRQRAPLGLHPPCTSASACQ
jgi:hypothetical protein